MAGIRRHAGSSSSSPNGAFVIDTPGMRELQLWVADEGFEEAFADVTSLFEKCRFSDCGTRRSRAAR